MAVGKGKLANLTDTLAGPRRRVRLCYFNTWAQGLEDAAAYLQRLPALDLSRFVTKPQDVGLMRMARLDCDWYGENLRCFTDVQHEEIEFLPAQVTGSAGILDLAKQPPEPDVERWFITTGHQPQSLGAAAGRAFALLRSLGVRHLYYAYDEASRAMPCFATIAPHLDVLIHDESPLEPRMQALLPSHCRTLHRSWVANLLPGQAFFNEEPERKILFLGSKLGLTPHRQRQIDFLQVRFKDQFVASCDHSLAVGARLGLNRFKVGFCPEGRKFTTPGMSATHTDRPFWSGCLGLVPVSEDSTAGGRLEELHRANLIVRYSHGDLEALAKSCERTLEMSNAERRRIYDHFNAQETVGTVVAGEIAAATLAAV
jgi:hypothetical protein